MKLLVEGLYRGLMLDLLSDGPAPFVSVRPSEDEPVVDVDLEAMVNQVARLFDDFNRRHMSQGQSAITASPLSQEDPGRFADQVAGFLPVPTEQKQLVLEALPLPERLRRVRALPRGRDREAESRPAP